jgi:RNA polymerase sigma-70 factor (ECF subfamily)
MAVMGGPRIASPEAELTGTDDRSETVRFEDFFHAHHARLFRALTLVTGNRNEAEELMQDAFLKLWERWDRVASLEDPAGYLYRTGMNLFRSRARRTAIAVRKAVGRLPPDDAMGSVEERDMLLRALASVSPKQRAAVVLIDVLDMSSDDAGAALGVRPVTARVLASKARAALRRTLEESDE